MKRIGILYYAGKEESIAVAAEVRDWLRQQEADPWIAPNDDRLADDARLPETDLLVVLGGDGAVLHASRHSAACQAPLFCINMGRIGFLSEAELNEWKPKLARYLAGEFWLERRLMLQAEIHHNEDAPTTVLALNDVVVGRGTHARVVHLALYVDNIHVTTYTADGLIVATPTGSTAYSMAAGGPLLPPQLQNFLVMPVAPHLSLNRALVLHRTAVITIQVGMDHEAMVTADGQATVPLRSGDRVVLQRHRQEAVFARTGGSDYFYERIMRLLGVTHHGTSHND
jgi:NAD+ kinase